LQLIFSIWACLYTHIYRIDLVSLHKNIDKRPKAGVLKRKKGRKASHLTKWHDDTHDQTYVLQVEESPFFIFKDDGDYVVRGQLEAYSL
jgi:hypothetical protein